MPGGVGGVAPRGVPLSRLMASIAVAAPYPVPSLTPDTDHESHRPRCADACFPNITNLHLLDGRDRLGRGLDGLQGGGCSADGNRERQSGGPTREAPCSACFRFPAWLHRSLAGKRAFLAVNSVPAADYREADFIMIYER